MKKYLLLVSIPFLTLTLLCFSQDTPKSIVSINAGIGMMTFYGDIGTGKDISAYRYIRGGRYLNIEKRFAQDKMSISLNILGGKLAMGERSTLVERNNNFESSFTQFGLNISRYFLNKKDIPLIPYVTAGLAFASFKTFSDKKYNGYSMYYYWNDGSIRDLIQIPANEPISKHVTLDHTYETPLDNAAKSTAMIPVGIGTKIKLGKKLDINVGLTYHLTFSDDIDAFKKGGSDKYLFSYLSATYTITKKSKKEKEQSTVDFSSIDALDLDADGVKDDNDECPGTPKGTKVNGKGCPFDADGDGVPDYLDKEAATKKGALVDGEGKTVTDAMMLEKAKRDSIAYFRTSIFMSAPSSASLQQLDNDIKNKKASEKNTSAIPPQFSGADTNHDGIISSVEISSVIEGFFDGTNDYTVAKIHALIDYFFEQ